MSEDLKLRQRILTRWGTLKKEREPYMTQWLEISEHITPSRGRFLFGKNRNESRSRWNRIVDSSAVRAANILAAGLMSGMTDPSSQWFALTTGTPNLDEAQAVKVWLDQVQRIMEMAFTRTNTYQALHQGWRDVGTYGVMAMVIAEDDREVFHCYPLSVGEYAIGVDDRGVPDTLYRRFIMTAAQLVARFGRSKLSADVLRNFDAGQVDHEYKLIHAIEPRFDRQYGKRDSRNMPWRSVIIQIDSDGTKDGILEESGFNEFPCVVGRWGASASDVYSEESPGMVALGDVRQLQHEQKQKGNSIDYIVNPPLIMPTAARDNEDDFEPGGRIYLDAPAQKDAVQSAWQVQMDINALRQDIAEVQQRINQAFSVDMFLMLSGQQMGKMTATEVAERHEEKLMMLGPVLSRLNNEVLKPLIERTFSILYRAGQLPPAPPELAGVELSIEYTSMLARSQRAIRANSLDQFLQRIGQVAQFDPNVLAKIDSFRIVDEYADYLSVAPSVVVPTEQAQQKIEAQQQAQQQAQQAEQMQQAADAVSKLGRVPADGSTVGGQAVQGMQELAQQGAL
ncbi:portal protein [Sutterella wadsworthensis]|uniref:portal protein n=1 Tax=Sutterella wadsworthensis TaxID=40545 RepID=UPI0013F5AECB|nr:portal protein [Sutterella wadsworthensis]